MTSIYTLTIFTSAFLLFLIQPMISKLLLPHLGGTPALWNTAMMFFQMLLLAGYAYAHISVTLLGAKRQARLHLLLLAVALAWLPVTAKTELGFSGVTYPLGWVVASLALSVGVPFFVLAANAPLLQRWLAETDQPYANNPYFLYSASNAGSLLALCGYPFLIEPLLALPEQSKLWSVLFVLFIALMALCVRFLQRHHRPVAEETGGAAAPSRAQRLRWVMLAFFPSSLLLGVTTYITMDIASMPLFWVIPLALYLVTFILAFASRPLLVDAAIRAQVLLVPLTALALISRINHATLILLLHLVTFFVLALGCHGTLARSRPHPKYLTEFYLWISFGGMLGGVFNALVAPQLFTGLIEYPLVLALALLARPRQGDATHPAREARLDVAVPGLILLAAGLFVGATYLVPERALSAVFQNEWLLRGLAVAACASAAMLAASLAKRPVRFAFSILALLMVMPLARGDTTQIFAERNFFGVNRVYHRPADNAMLLLHGTTVHGMQGLAEEYRLKPTSYYTPLKAALALAAPALRQAPVAVLGLGAGTLACLGQPGQVIDFYEIDPAVAAIASNPEFFTYLRDCSAASSIHMGDGRLEIAGMPDGHYGVMVMDAFSSDSIPVHLLTREALRIYLSKLAQGGWVLFNISNRHLNLAPLMSALAQDAGLAVRIKLDAQPPGTLTTSSVWVVMARQDADIAPLDAQGWNRPEPSATAVWTDHYSNILAAMF